jgi:hypothetical protein
MWDTIKTVLTSQNGVLISVLLLVLIIMVLVLIIALGKSGLLKINTKYVTLGNKVSDRELIRRQIEKAHEFVMSIEGKIVSSESNYDEYFVKYILERIYDKVIEWITFNHITVNQLYIQDKQDTILNLIYALPIHDEFKTPEFKNRVENWVKELVEQLVNVKTLYYNQQED